MIEWLESIPPLVIYVVVGLIVGLESVGIPLPGELALVSASIVASQGSVNPWVLGSIAALGATVGDSAGYAIGKRYGTALLVKLGKKAPKHFGPHRVAKAEKVFDRWGAWTVFGGRFVVLLRMLAGPLSGILGMSYGKFLLANATGAVVWAGSTCAVAYVFGLVAEQWLHKFSWLALGAVVATGLVVVLVTRWRRAKRAKVPTTVKTEVEVG